MKFWRAFPKIGDLKVISRTSTRRFKSAPSDLPEIAAKLGVANILEGSVQKSGDAVRVGEADAAITSVEKLLQTNGERALTPALLRLDPMWNPLRSDPRFERLAAP